MLGAAGLLRLTLTKSVCAGLPGTTCSAYAYWPARATAAKLPLTLPCVHGVDGAATSTIHKPWLPAVTAASVPLTATRCPLNGTLAAPRATGALGLAMFTTDNPNSD